jgi:hypothetical protein
MASKIKLRRDISANWQSVNPILSEGEVGVEINTSKIKFGNGVDRWNTLPYFVDVIPSGSVSSSLQVVEYIDGTNITPLSVTSSFDGNLFGTASYATSASYALSASYAETVNQDFIGNVSVDGTLQSNEFKLDAGEVSITFTGSVNAGVFGVTEDVLPYISTLDYSGTTIEYVAQRLGATRIGMILATWSGSSVVFTDVSSADIGDTTDISFAFIKSGDFFKLRVNSSGSGSGPWTVQSLFKLFPNLNT